MESLSMDLTHWHWFTIGVIFFAIELFVPTSFILWPAIAAIITGFITLFLPAMAWQLQLALFALLAVTVTLAGRHFYKNKPDGSTSHPTLNRRAEAIKGRVITLDKPIENGVGSVMIDDTRWRLIGEDAPIGTKLMVTGTDGSSLTVDRHRD